MSLFQSDQGFKALKQLTKNETFLYIVQDMEKKKSMLLKELTHSKEASNEQLHYLRGQVFTIEQFLSDIESVKLIK